jgi:hypothetical protein
MVAEEAPPTDVTVQLLFNCVYYKVLRRFLPKV